MTVGKEGDVSEVSPVWDFKMLLQWVHCTASSLFDEPQYLQNIKITSFFVDKSISRKPMGNQDYEIRLHICVMK